MRIRHKLYPDQSYEVISHEGDGWVGQAKGEDGCRTWYPATHFERYEPIPEPVWEDVTGRCQIMRETQIALKVPEYSGTLVLPIEGYRLVKDRLWRKLTGFDGQTDGYQPVDALRVERKR